MSTTAVEEQHRVSSSINEKHSSTTSTDLDTFTPEEESYFKKQFYGIQKVILMKRLGGKWDKLLVVTGYT